MKRTINLLIATILLLGVMTGVASAQTDTPPLINPANALRGQVTAIEGDTILVENRQGEVSRIITTDETRFRLGKQEATLADIEPGHLVLTAGEKHDDASLTARWVIATTRQQLRRHSLHGEVLSVDVSAGTVTVQAQGQKEGVWTVQTDEQTNYRIRNVDNPTLADIPVGARIAAVGKQAEEGENIGLARLIILVPENAGRGAGGEVLTLTGNGFTLQSLNRGELTILTDESTQYRTRGEQKVSAADVQPGSKVIVMGQPVDGDETTIQAKMVGIKTD